MQAVVDNRILFRDVTAQHPGCNHDASVLSDSYLYQNHNRLFPQSQRELLGINDDHGNPVPFVVPYYLIGDPAYPLRSWIMKNYPIEMNQEETSFNLCLNTLRIIVEHAFGRLKGRWRILCKTSDLYVYNMPHVIVACAMLHNFVEKARQPYHDRWDAERVQLERAFPQPEGQVLVGGGNNEDIDANLLRDHLCAYMACTFPLKSREEGGVD